MKTTETLAAVSGEENAAIFSDRARIRGILESPEGRRNPALANELALHTSLDVDTAKSILSKAPADNPYTAAMNVQGPIGGLGGTAATATFDNDPKAARKQEIAESMTRFNLEKGYTSKVQG